MVFQSRLYIKIFIFVSIAALVIGYSFFQTKNILLGPVITVNKPINGETLSQSLIEVSGNSKNTTDISLNDKQIFVNEEGVFYEKLLLSYGYNIITIKAHDRFGRETKETLEIVYK